MGVFADTFSDCGITVDMPVVEQAMSEAELLAVIEGYDGVIAGDDPFTASVLERGRKLRVISKWGVGVDGIDLEAAERLGIAVTNTPNVFHSEVADVCIGYLVMLARQLHRIDAAVRSGVWLKIQGMTLAGRTLGIIGLGSIGLAVARRAMAMDMVVVGCDSNPAAMERAAGCGVEVSSLAELLPRVDAISINCPLTPSTFHLLDVSAFERMQKGVLIVNTARGPLIDEYALIDAIAAGRVAGAALDVFENEPLSRRSPLLDFPQVILGSHNGSNTYDAAHKVSALAVENLLQRLGTA